jgi:hypothetical protein
MRVEMPAPLRQKVQGPALHRAVVADASVIDEAARRIRVSFSSEHPVLRASFWDEPWIEVLSHDPGDCDMSRLEPGTAPFLWAHDPHSRENLVGVVEKAWIEKGRGYAEIRVSMRADCDGLWTDIKGGIVSNISVGYWITERTLTKQTKGEPSEYRCKWLPFEISTLPIPADAGVGIGRSDDAARSFTVTTIEEPNMSDKTTKPDAPAPDGQRAADTVTVQTQAPAPVAAVAGVTPEVRSLISTEVNTNLVAERTRCTAIQQLARQHGLSDTFAETHIQGGTSLEAARSLALDELAKRDPSTMPRMSAGADSIDKQRDAATSWLLHRGGEKVDAALLNGNDFRGMTLLDVARATLQARGVSVRGLDPAELVKRAISHSTSDFPILLQNVMHKTLNAAYVAIPDVWRTFCAVGTVSDFRPHYRYRMGSFGDIAEVKEDGSFTYGTIVDAERDSVTAKTKGKLMNISREMIINDDLGGFLNMARIMGRGAARTVEKDVFALLAANPTLGDTGALFNSTAVTTAGGHANITSYVAPSVASFETVRVAMASQVDVGANDYISVPPSIWLGPMALGGTARVVNDSQYDVDAVTTNATNKFQVPNKSRGLFKTIVDTPRLTGSLWYAFADPALEPVIEVAFLNGNQSPTVEMQDAFTQNGVVWKIFLDYAVGAVGYRGAHKVV